MQLRLTYDGGVIASFRCNLDQNCVAVSYTHLDVYKRQELAHGGERTSVRKKSGLNLFPQTLV